VADEPRGRPTNARAAVRRPRRHPRRFPRRAARRRPRHVPPQRVKRPGALTPPPRRAASAAACAARRSADEGRRRYPTLTPHAPAADDHTIVGPPPLHAALLATTGQVAAPSLLFASFGGCIICNGWRFERSEGGRRERPEKARSLSGTGSCAMREWREIAMLRLDGRTDGRCDSRCDGRTEDGTDGHSDGEPPKARRPSYPNCAGFMIYTRAGPLSVQGSTKPWTDKGAHFGGLRFRELTSVGSGSG
jgi:hypothetical protein